MAMNALSGFGVAAAVGFMKGEGIAAPDIGAAVSSFAKGSVAEEFNTHAGNSDIGPHRRPRISAYIYQFSAGCVIIHPCSYYHYNTLVT